MCKELRASEKEYSAYKQMQLLPKHPYKANIRFIFVKKVYRRLQECEYREL
jgi:hypothetical protein